MLVTTLLADTLAVLLALGSLTFYIAAFFYPEVHRRSDFVWGGLGLTYALVLWVGAGQMTWVVLLGQLVAVVLLLGLGWQTLTVRREKTPVYQQTPITLTPEVVGDWAKNQLNQLRIAPVDAVPVRLEKRPSGGPRQDPRRRPAYEYEFVEDGLVDVLEEVPADSFADLLNRPSPNAPSTEETPSVPPSVAAEIISVEGPKTDEIPEAVVVEADTKEAKTKDEADVVDGADKVGSVPSDPTSESAPEATILETTSEDPTSEVSTPEVPTTSEIAPDPTPEPATEEPVAAPTPASLAEPAPEPVPLVMDDVQPEAATATSSVEQDADDWDDDFFEDDEDNNWAEVEAASVPVASVLPVSVKDTRASGEPKISSGQSPSQSPEPSSRRETERSPDSVPESDTERKVENKTERAVNKTREKPSLLATPVILAGWVKDVVVSMTQPKPSKPVIEIPRREPGREAMREAMRSQPASPSPDAASSPRAYTTAQPSERTAEKAAERTADRDIYQNDMVEPVADFSTDDNDDSDWEESNWDD
ncbi:MAG: Ycf66 family protein [Cyanobacteria bacterium P01_F01_bin.53]